jgi:hypothetical protein
MTIEELQKGVEGLKPDELARFRAWYEQFDAALFDAKIERDSKNGRFERAFSTSEEDFRAGRFREI